MSQLKFITILLSIGLLIAITTAADAQTNTGYAYWVRGVDSISYGGPYTGVMPPPCTLPAVVSTISDIPTLAALDSARANKCVAALNQLLTGQVQSCPGEVPPEYLFLYPMQTVAVSPNTGGPGYGESRQSQVGCPTNGLDSLAMLTATVYTWNCVNGYLPVFIRDPKNLSNQGYCVYAGEQEPSFFLVMPTFVPTKLGPCSATATDEGCVETQEPINPATGNESLTEQDYASADGRLRVVRTYHSNDLGSGRSGLSWKSSYLDSRVLPINGSSQLLPFSVSASYADPATACSQGWSSLAPYQSGASGVTATWTGSTCALSNGTNLTVYSDTPNTSYPAVKLAVSVQRSDGSEYLFTCASTCTASPGVALRANLLTGGGFQVISETDDVETYSASGQLLSVTARNGYTQTLSYNGDRVSSVTDSFGDTLTYQYNTRGLLQSVTTPSGMVTYAYNTVGNLISVTYPDAAFRSYSYSNGSFPNLLTTVIDENNATYATIGYDSNARAVSSSLANGAWASTIDYSNPLEPVVTDSLGVARIYHYSLINGQPKLVSISGGSCDDCGAPAAQTFDAAGYVSSRKDFNGILSCYQNDPARGLEQVRVEGLAPGSSCPSNLSSYVPLTGTSERKIVTLWNSNWRLPDSITRTGQTTTYTYDASGNQLTKTLVDTTASPQVSRTWTFTYNSLGQALTADGPRNDVSDVTTYTYWNCTTGTECGHLHTITDAVGHQTIFSTYNGSGQPLVSTDRNGIVTTRSYDARQRLKTFQVGSETTIYDYYPTGLLQKATSPDGSFVSYHYDDAHSLDRITDSTGNYIQYSLNSKGRRTAIKSYDPSNTLLRTHTRTFNNLGRLDQDINAAGTIGVSTGYGYDAQGNQISVAAPLGRNRSGVFDALNRLTQETDPGSGTTKYVYDDRDNVIKVTDPRSHSTLYTLNGFDEVIQTVSPDTGTSFRTYDLQGNLKTVSDGRSAQGTYTYDALNRPTQLAFSDQTITFNYDQGNNGVGRLTGASDASHAISWAYDALGRVVGKSQVVAGITKSIGYGYTNADLTSMVTPSGQTITYTYTNHRITSIKINGATLLSGVTYDGFGPAKSWNWGNGTTTNRSFDQDGNPAQIITAGVTNTYTVDNATRITGISDSGLASNSFTFGYDNLDRVTSGTSSAITRGNSYDANGNWISLTGTLHFTPNISPTSNQVVSTTGQQPYTFSYDQAGNTTGFGGTNYHYNQRGRIDIRTSGPITTNYIYDALGQMIYKGPGGGVEMFFYDEQGHMVTEYGASGSLIEETIWLNDVPVAVLKPSGSSVAIYYIHADHLNPPRKITRPSDNALEWRWDPDTFGATQPNINPAGLGNFIYNLRFPGQYYLNESALLYSYFRTYNPQQGRFLEADPLGIAAGVNPYAYVDNNPVVKADPLGLLTGVTIWHPGGWASSSFGHVSVDINGITYSFGPGGMTIMSTPNFNELNGFRDGMELFLDITAEQESLLELSLMHKQPPYNAFFNNCATPVQIGLRRIGIDTDSQMFPVSLGNQLIDLGVVNGVLDHPASRPSAGTSAPWAR